MSTLNTDAKTYQRLLVYLAPYRKRFLISFAASIPASLLNGAVAWLIGPLFDQIVKSQDYSVFTYIPFVVLGTLVFQALFEYIADYSGTHVAASITRDLRRDLFYSMSKMDLGFFKRHTSGELFNRYYKDPVQLEQAIVNNLQGFIIQFFSMIFLVGVLLYRNTQLALASVAIMSLIVYPLTILSKKVRRLDHQLLDIGTGLFNRFQEAIAGAKVLQSFNLESFQRKRFDKASIEFFQGTMRIQKTSILLKPIMQFIAGIGISSILFIGGLQVQSGTMSPGDLASFIIALVLLYKPVKVIGGIFGKVQRIFAPAERVFIAMDKTSPLTETENPVTLQSFESLRLEGVSFHYEPGKPVLNNISLTVLPGESVALVGPSGGGKSTLVDLIPRFLDPQEGSLWINDIDMRHVSLHQLRELISVVSQETVLFEGSIQDNILMGKLDATPGEVSQAVQMANLTSWVNSLPDGLETEIGERGGLISGGQKQRIAIARAFLKNAPLLILDEATSALDNESEALVQESLSQLMQGKTVIVIAHRLSTIKNSDKILVIEKGCIAESGTHEELLRLEGVYHRFYQLQFRNTETMV